VYDTPSKRGMGNPLGLAALAAAVVQSPIPVFALGGIHHPQVAQVMATGCHGVGLISEVFTHPRPGVGVAALLRALDAP